MTELSRAASLGRVVKVGPVTGIYRRECWEGVYGRDMVKRRERIISQFI